MDERNVADPPRWSLRREPLLLFLILGAALYGIWVVAAPPDLENIRIEEAALRAMETQQMELIGRELTEKERMDIREAYIDDEVLLREALNRGLQYSDFRVRQRLTRIMRGALTETVADPSVAQLQAYFRDNIDRFSVPESISFNHVVFPWGTDQTETEIENILARLRAGADWRDIGSDDPLIPRGMRRQSRSDMVQGFGSDFADAVEGMTVGRWMGPLRSVQGVHLVLVHERHPPEVATFESVEPYLRQDWMMTKTRELQQKGIDEIRARYNVEIVEE